MTREYIRVYCSSGIKVGATFENLYLVKPRTFEPYGSPPALKSEELEVMLGPKWRTQAPSVFGKTIRFPS